MSAEGPAFRVLVIDDNEDGALALTILLQVLGHEVCTAHSGQEGLEVAAQFCPQLILLDIGMPTMNGYEVCRRIREEAWGRDIVVIALSGWGRNGDRRRSEEAGFDRHLVKPVAPEELARLIEELKNRQ